MGKRERKKKKSKGRKSRCSELCSHPFFFSALLLFAPLLCCLAIVSRSASFGLPSSLSLAPFPLFSLFSPDNRSPPRLSGLVDFRALSGQSRWLTSPLLAPLSLTQLTHSYPSLPKSCVVVGSPLSSFGCCSSPASGPNRYAIPHRLVRPRSRHHYSLPMSYIGRSGTPAPRPPSNNHLVLLLLSYHPDTDCLALCHTSPQPDVSYPET
ncbi:hypothetical protein BO83DRAFT_186996 [Aspergillus eucalypticola CBS 122712]|uniref:Uncharacterized protein n=1 Tax=Aspergillus eucalypticola (strain CBS 122712 / IBT 29274) TaxID=1448314 RepID=A0A317UL10_ASPEC|nr:uncharacterized protein BO83DRAFT_186996 [Aspergillus eucalypticola CBS 122712]PWY62674.1 hypothetical protein BO83DRAFT_186996 [Aspergillus eucalypticola CBS 122712]